MEKFITEQTGNETVIPNIVNHIVDYLSEYSILLISGDLGAGKTTLTQQLFRTMGVTDQVTSPTFNLVNVYRNKQGEESYHFDLYRIKHPAELSDIGFEDYLDSGKICVIEWPEIMESNFDYPHLKLEIEHDSLGRKYSLKSITNGD